MSEFDQFPPQQLPYTRKNKAWRKRCVDWADNKTFVDYTAIRTSILHKKINYDLINGILHMDDLMKIVNPSNIKAGYIPNNIQHFPIMNSKLNVLRGEESKRLFDFKVIVTNPNMVSEIEKEKTESIKAQVMQAMQQQSQSDEEFQQKLQELDDYYSYDYQDMREVRANALLNHYWKELNIPLIFNQGFMDACTVAEELYMCDIVGGEPTIERLNPMKVRIYRSGYSNRIEDADVILIEDYWSPGRVIDTYYDVLSKRDMEYIEKLPMTIGQSTDSMGNVDERLGFINMDYADTAMTSERFFSETVNGLTSLLPYDNSGNIRVLRLFWKSRRKIKKVKYYDEEGEEQFNFYPETYVCDKDLGEEEEVMWINEAWEGTKIGKDIYVNMRPRVIQYNRLSNPSRCHFGIIGSIYNLNESKPFSLVDMMKPYNYLYDAVHDRLNKMIDNNWGKILQLDLAKIPKDWDVEKWLYYAKINNIAVVDSFKEGNYGAATGKLAGAFSGMAGSGVLDAELGNSIQANIQLLEYIKQDMADIVGISRQREGQIANRETVGGVERSTLQSSYITEWLFLQHDDVKKRALECFLETAKIAMRGRSKKFQYILSDNAIQIMDIDGDEFAECDYGLVLDNSNALQQLNQKIDILAQAALQNQSLSFSSVMKLYNSSSLAEKERMIEKSEREMQERQQQMQEQQNEIAQQQIQAASQQKEAEMKARDAMNERDNQTRITVAQIEAQAEAQRFALSYGEAGLEKQKIEIEKLKQELEKKKHEDSKAMQEEQMAFDREKFTKELEVKKIQAKAQVRKANMSTSK